MGFSPVYGALVLSPVVYGRVDGTGALSLLHLMGGLLRLAQHAEEVAAEDLHQLLLPVAAVEQRLRQVRIAADILQLARSAVDAVEVAADADVVDAGNLDDVVDVVGDVVHR